jgi:hypothetical protein
MATLRPLDRDPARASTRGRSRRSKGANPDRAHGSIGPLQAGQSRLSKDANCDPPNHSPETLRGPHRHAAKGAVGAVRTGWIGTPRRRRSGPWEGSYRDLTRARCDPCEALNRDPVRRRSAPGKRGRSGPSEVVKPDPAHSSIGTYDGIGRDSTQGSNRRPPRGRWAPYEEGARHRRRVRRGPLRRGRSAPLRSARWAPPKRPLDPPEGPLGTPGRCRSTPGNGPLGTPRTAPSARCEGPNRHPATCRSAALRRGRSLPRNGPPGTLRRARPGRREQPGQHAVKGLLGMPGGAPLASTEGPARHPLNACSAPSEGPAPGPARCPSRP